MFLVTQLFQLDPAQPDHTTVCPMINQSELCEFKVTELLFGLEEEHWQHSHSHVLFDQAHMWLKSSCSPGLKVYG